MAKKAIVCPLRRESKATGPFTDFAPPAARAEEGHCPSGTICTALSLIAARTNDEAGKRLMSSPNLTQNADNDLWEKNRMLTSGVASRTAVDMDFEDEAESRVHVLVHDLKPPFLDGKTAFTKQLEPVNPIRDPTSDLAIFSKKGSALVREKREQQERAKVRLSRSLIVLRSVAALRLTRSPPSRLQPSWLPSAAAPSATCSVSRRRSRARPAPARARPVSAKFSFKLGQLSRLTGRYLAGFLSAEAEGQENYKSDSQFASHMKSSQGASDFSRQNTIREQRQLLPAFGCREELMTMIRENQGAVLLGDGFARDLF